ncbi:protein phosphatase 1 regulatory subunit 1A [Alligator mississippiensis]|uniref:Protein phosphatase 1 regulatory subunit 1A n=1 Tax=Alligator mississippiensis TaxID=8496 RepID=A0A151MW47_ALLMI|nr:protein phosphatase 1 regulatory subunit 1A [Alligator mississippiensis]
MAVGLQSEVDEDRVPNPLLKSGTSMSPRQRKKVSRTTPTMKELQMMVEHHLCKQQQEEEEELGTKNQEQPSPACCPQGGRPGGTGGQEAVRRSRGQEPGHDQAGPGHGDTRLTRPVDGLHRPEGADGRVGAGWGGMAPVVLSRAPVATCMAMTFACR